MAKDGDELTTTSLKNCNLADNGMQRMKGEETAMGNAHACTSLQFA
jgi:hypothetical protein